jgi:hypothetical protein
MAWLVILLAINGWIFWKYVRKLPRQFDRNMILIVQSLLLIIGFNLPLWDEIMGVPEIEALCNGPERSSLKIDAEKTRGKKVKLVISYKDIEGTILPIIQEHRSYRDVETNEEYATANWYYGEGGWLYRGILGNVPQHLRTKHTCDHTHNIREIENTYQFEVVDIDYEINHEIDM